MPSRRLPRWLASPLVTAQLVGVFMLLRSVAFDRWMTALVSVALVFGARAAMRGRSWGLLVAFASASWYLAVFLLGIAAPMFVPFAFLAALPLIKAWRAFTHFDRGAAVTAAALAASAGVLGAAAWKSAIGSLVEAFPALTPTLEANHGAALLAILGTAIVVGVRDRRAAAEPDATGSGVRVGNVDAGSPMRIAAFDEALEHDLERDDAEPDGSARARDRLARR